MSQNKKLIIIGLLLMMIGFLSGWLGFLLFGDIASYCTVLFVSGDQVIKLEEERIRGKKGGEQTLFLGKDDEALARIEKIAKSFGNRRTKILLVSSASGKALGGVAISEIVHKELIKALEEEEAKE